MDLPEYLEWPVAQNLAYRIVESLEGFPFIEEDQAARRIVIKGRLPLGDRDFSTKATALCVFAVDHQWAFKIPKVFCLEPWITRKMPEWHIGSDGGLCFELAAKWNETLPPMVDVYTFGLTGDYATQWLLNSTRSLLTRHLFAHRHGIQRWPKEWDYWSHHADIAFAEFKREIQSLETAA